MNLSRIQKTTTFIVIALAIVGAVGVMGAMITTSTTADALPRCVITPQGEVCQGPPEGGPRCIIITPQEREICPGPP